MSPPQSPSQREALVIYDGECRLCVRAKAGIERLQASERPCQTRFVPYQSAEAAEALGAEYRPGQPDVAFLVRPDGGIERGLAAFLPLLPGLRGGRLMAALFKVPLFKAMTKIAYRYVARYRYRLFGRVPPPAA